MKGIVFTEFNEMVESHFSPEIADRIIMEAAPASGAAYTAVGTYDHQELIDLVASLSRETGIPANELVKTFGRHLAQRFTALYPGFFEGVDSLFGFLETIESHVHVEVRKLYPDAELPSFATQRIGPDELEMTYTSRRPFADLAEGLIAGCAKHFGDRVTISRVEESDGRTRFKLQRSTQ
jgi:hypothetical protein